MSPQTDDFNTFDDLKASLRFILALLEENATGLDRKSLINHMEAQDVSQNQVYKTITTLMKIGLIEETEKKRGNVRSVHTRLTPKGVQVAQLALKIKQALT